LIEPLNFKFYFAFILIVAVLLIAFQKSIITFRSKSIFQVAIDLEVIPIFVHATFTYKVSSPFSFA
jgi:uncharacterized Tic20 family protein